MAAVIAVEQIRLNYQSILGRLDSACRAAGRDAGQVRLLVVTKTHPIEAVQAVGAAGAHHIGESYVDEALPKIEALQAEGFEWHMIGHVQSRKSAAVAGSFDWLHSLDSLKLARRLSRACQEAGRSLKVLFECNISGESSKSGFPVWDSAGAGRLVEDLEQILSLPGLIPMGLMTIPPLSDEPEQSRPYFRRLRELRDDLSKRFPAACWSELSMGMSGDFEIAVQEGATWVRVGTAIMGPRVG